MKPGRRKFWGYVTAPAFVAVAVFVRSLLLPDDPDPETAILLVAVTASSLLGGIGPGLFSVAVGGLQETWWQMLPRGSFAVASTKDRVELAIFVFTGLLVAIVIDGLDRAKRREARAAAALRASEERFRSYVESAPIGIFVVDGRGRYLDFNPAALDLFRVDAETLRSMTISSFVEETDVPAVMADFGELLATGRLDRDYRLRRRDGSRFWTTLRAVRIGDDRYMAFCQDVSSLKDAESGARERERFLATILSTALDGFWVVDEAGRLLDVNPAYCEMSGYGRDELLAMRIQDLEAAERPEETAARVEKIRVQGFDRFQTTHRRKDGSTIQVMASVRFVHLDRPLMVCFFQDVTERERASRALRESERRYRTLVTGMASGLVLQSRDGSIVDCNPAAERLLGLTADEMRGRTSLDPRWRALREDGTPFPGEELPPMVALRTGTSQSEQVLAIHRPDGQVTWLSLNAEPLRDARGQVYAVLSTFVNVTRRRAAEAERARLQAQLAHAARLAAMGTLVAGVAHEINNPLSALMSNAGTALEEVRAFQRSLDARTISGPDTLSARSHEVLEMLVDVETSARRIADIVRDLTILGRPDQAKEAVDVAAVARDALGRLPAAVTRRVVVRHELEPVPPVSASPGQIEQVLSNLVANAALSSPEGRKGEVVVRVHPGPEGMVRLEVSDDGPGIPAGLRERIFEPFFTTRPLGNGTGLGLSICNAIVGAHGGTIAIASEPGRGATFTIDLPTMPAGITAPVA